jgi:hypothetical protein
MNPAAGKLAQELLKKYASAVMSGGGAGVKTALEGSKRLGAIAQGNPEVAAKALSQLPVIGKASMGLPLSMNTIQGAAQALPAVAGGATTLGLGAGSVIASNMLANAVTNPVKPTAFSTQQYTPGRSPLTNEMAAEAILDQQRFMHQMQLIEARNAAAAGSGSLQSGVSSNFDMMKMANQAANQMFTTPNYA